MIPFLLILTPLALLLTLWFTFVLCSLFSPFRLIPLHWRGLAPFLKIGLFVDGLCFRFLCNFYDLFFCFVLVLSPTYDIIIFNSLLYSRTCFQRFFMAINILILVTNLLIFFYGFNYHSLLLSSTIVLYYFCIQYPPHSSTSFTYINLYLI